MGRPIFYRNQNSLLANNVNKQPTMKLVVHYEKPVALKMLFVLPVLISRFFLLVRQADFWRKLNPLEIRTKFEIIGLNIRSTESISFAFCGVCFN